MVFGKYISEEKGMALLIALMLTLMLSIIGLGIIKSANDEISIAGNELHEMVAFYAAETGLEKASAAIQTYFEIHRVAPDKLPHVLEGWNGTDLNLTRSMVQGRNSRQATGTWRYIQASDSYYSTSTRNWTFNTDFEDPSKLPQETPQIQLFQRTSWCQADIGYIGIEDQVVDSLGL